MNERATYLARRRQRLQQRCTGERLQIRSLSADIESRLSGLDRGANMLQALTRPSVLIALGIAGVIFIKTKFIKFKPMGVFRWFNRGAFLINAVRRLRGLSHH